MSFTKFGAKDPETDQPQKVDFGPPSPPKTKENQENYIHELQQLQQQLKRRIHNLLKNPKLFPL